MRIKLPVRYLLNPSTVVIMTALLSAIAWSVPSFGVLRKGFNNRADLSLFSAEVMFCWYTCTCFAFYVGQKFGGLASRSFRFNSRIFDIDQPKYLYIYTACTALGVAITYYKILTSLSPAMAFYYVTHHQANQLKESLYDNYSAGLMSLRYLIVFSAPLAFRRYQKFKKLSPIVIANLLLLVFVSLLSARLLVVATILNTIFTTSYFKDYIRLRLLRTSIIVLAFFLVMSVFNFTRNGDYYDKRKLSFWGAGFSEIITYLGSPFQVAVGGAEAINNVTGVPSGTYLNYVDVEDDLNTNSAFIFLHEEQGYFAWLYIVVLALVMGALFRFLVGQGTTVFMLSAGSILYASAEIWRLDLFRQGIFITWMVCSLSLPILSNALYFLSKLVQPRQRHA